MVTWLAIAFTGSYWYLSNQNEADRTQTRGTRHVISVATIIIAIRLYRRLTLALLDTGGRTLNAAFKIWFDCE